MRKRICALALTSVFLCACLSGCSESSQPNAPASNSNNSYSSSTSDNNSSSSSESNLMKPMTIPIHLLQLKRCNFNTS